MSEFSRKPKFKVGDLVSLLYRTKVNEKQCTSNPILGIIVEVRPSTIQRLPMYWVHLPNGKRCNRVEEHLEFANARS